MVFYLYMFIFDNLKVFLISVVFQFSLPRLSEYFLFWVICHHHRHHHRHHCHHHHHCCRCHHHQGHPHYHSIFTWTTNYVSSKSYISSYIDSGRSPCDSKYTQVVPHATPYALLILHISLTGSVYTVCSNKF